MSEALTRTPEVIAAEIRVIKDHARRMLARDAMEIGKRLYEARAIVAHGKWGAWLEENVEYSESTARNFIRLYEEYGKTGNPQALEDIGYTQAAMLLGLPPEQREALMAEPDFDELSTRELQERVSELRAENEKAQVTIDQLLGEKADAAQFAAGLMAGADALREDAAKARQEADRFRQQAEDAVADAGRARAEAARAREELEAEKNRPDPLPEVQIVERVPEVVARELEQLRRQAQAAPDEAVILLREAYRALVEQFKDVCGRITALAGTQPEEAAKYREAVRRAALNMAELMEKQD